ncbi:hypothetical protein CYMTET_20609 [Cymbomonas tetramitiformis]|uniref:Cyclic nucleotide-binding domain-containing protein n=1 Tax=Cymbomonas tetramitiformis TaxID=36881 RepID=A0AAE0G474_9CHLO|nr:hypothetical protein CYMTET_20609 [Cymbomonas tetramitiformis]
MVVITLPSNGNAIEINSADDADGAKYRPRGKKRSSILSGIITDQASRGRGRRAAKASEAARRHWAIVRKSLLSADFFYVENTIRDTLNGKPVTAPLGREFFDRCDFQDTAQMQFNAGDKSDLELNIAWPKLVISPFSAWKASWDWIMVLLVFYTSTTLPWNLAFEAEERSFSDCYSSGAGDDEDSNKSCYPGYFVRLDAIVDIVFIVDFFLCFRCAYIVHPAVVTDPKKIAIHYLTGFFLLDFLAVFPFDLVVSAGGGDNGDTITALKLSKLPRLMRLGKLMRKLDELAAANALRLIRLVIVLLMVAHWMACLYFFIGRMQTEGDESGMRPWIDEIGWLPVEYASLLSAPVNSILAVVNPYCPFFVHQFGGGAFLLSILNRGLWRVAGTVLCCVSGIRDSEMLTQYSASLYWAVKLISACDTDAYIGIGIVAPYTNVERIFMIFATMLGAIASGTMLASLVNSISKFDEQGAKFRDMMGQINEFLMFHRVPTKLSKRIRTNAVLSNSLTGGFDSELVCAALPGSLQGEVKMHMYIAMLQRVDFLQETDVTFLKAIATKLKMEIFLPEDRLVLAGDINEDMYFITCGKIQMLSEDEQVLLGILHQGDFFGEQCILPEPTMRQATYQALTFCQTHVIHREQINKILKIYPNYSQRLCTIVKKREENERQSRLRSMQQFFVTVHRSSAFSAENNKGTSSLASINKFTEISLTNIKTAFSSQPRRERERHLSASEPEHDHDKLNFKQFKQVKQFKKLAKRVTHVLAAKSSALWAAGTHARAPLPSLNTSESDVDVVVDDDLATRGQSTDDEPSRTGGVSEDHAL